MEYRLKFHPAAAKDLFKLTKKDKNLGKIIIDEHLSLIMKSPIDAGSRKRGDLSHIRGYNFRYKSINYRILYQVESDAIRIIALGIHDVAYRKAKKREQ